MTQNYLNQNKGKKQEINASVPLELRLMCFKYWTESFKSVFREIIQLLPHLYSEREEEICTKKVSDGQKEGEGRGWGFPPLHTQALYT